MKVYEHIATKLQALEAQQDINRNDILEDNVKADYKREDNRHRELEAFIAEHMPEGTALDYKFSSVCSWRQLNWLRFTYLGVTCTMELSKLLGYEGIDLNWLAPTDMSDPHQEGVQSRLLNALWSEV
jgi:hypothetical protein